MLICFFVPASFYFSASSLLIGEYHNIIQDYVSRMVKIKASVTVASSG